MHSNISVIIPFYRNKKFLIDALKSVELQSVLPDEVIIINDGSNEKIDNLSSNKFDLRIINQVNKELLMQEIPA